MQQQALVDLLRQHFPIQFDGYDPNLETVQQRAILKVFGIDSPFVSFLEQFYALKEFIADPKALVAAALKAAKVSPDQLSSAIQMHLQAKEELMKTIYSNFDKSVEQATADLESKTSAVKKTIEQAQSEIKGLAAQLEQRKKEFMLMQEELIKASEENQKFLAKIDANRKVTEQLNTDISSTIKAFSETIKSI